MRPTLSNAESTLADAQLDSEEGVAAVKSSSDDVCNLSARRRRNKLCYLCPAEETSITGVMVALLKGADGR